MMPERMMPGRMMRERADPSPPTSRAAGFTLLELLVALTVLGVLTALLSSGLSFGARVWDRERDQLEQQSELQTMQEVVRRLLTQAWPLSGSLAGSGQSGALVGSDSSVQFFGPPPAQSLSGGIYQYTLDVQVSAQGKSRLVLLWRRRAADGTSRAPRPTNAQPDEADRLRIGKEVVLIDGIGSARFSFFGSGEEGGKGQWRDRWQDASRLPALVRLEVTFPPDDRRRWPPLVVAPRITGTLGEG